MNREQYFEHVQDAIEALSNIKDALPRFARNLSLYEETIERLEWELNVEAINIAHKNGVKHARQAD